jgi:hypothetical protein
MHRTVRFMSTGEDGRTHMHTIETPHERGTMTTPTQLCARCRFHPASPRIAGYCSWDCYEADDDEDADEEDGDQAA